MRIKKRTVHIAILLLLFLSIMLPSTASAHTSLVEAKPAPDSQLKKSPKNITLTFSSKIEPDLSSITVYNQGGEQVKGTTENVSDDQKSLLLQLPELKTGEYKVSYQIVSTDGHPVEGTYNFTLTVPEPEKNKEVPMTELDQDEKEHQKITVKDKDMQTPKQVSNGETQHDHSTSTYLIRLLYYFSILALAGWVFWGIASSILTSSAKASYIKGSMVLRFFLFIMLLGYGYLQFNSLITGINDLQSLLFQTAFGFAWLLMFVTSMLGFLILHRSRIIDGLWISLLLIGEVIAGHAITYEPLFITSILDMAHLIAASIWIGGLFLIIVFWKHHRNFIIGFLPRFSKYALISILTLSVTGSLMAIIFLPNLSILWETLWGKVLLLKILAVLLVIIIGSIVRKALKNKQNTKLKHLIEWDFALMIGIVLLVGILTFVSPTQEFSTINQDRISFAMSIK
ncbi:copper resistance protein CopC/CopD [Virgibacillus necropolis]|uniref:copper resistance CopC/CopD family protein n=1 Tax=Virgibacillus necropolis TaxID=163877 RepID=UPI00384C2FA8